jgi:DNA-binding NtrC family response regulator
MEKQKHILVITDDENSQVIEMLLRLQVVPVIRRSIMSAINLLRHLSIIAIIIDKQHQDVDSIELILNARDVAGKIPIFVPEQYQRKVDWSIILTLGKTIVYNEKRYPLNNEITNFLETENEYIKDI